MREIDHNIHQYGGSPQEIASVRIEAAGTNHMVAYVLDGVGPTVLPEGQKLTFPLSSTVGEKRILQMDLQYSADGTYTVAVENVANCVIDTAHKNECVRHFKDFDFGTVLNYVFFTE